VNDQVSDSPFVDVIDVDQNRRGHAARRLMIGVMVALVLLGAGGLFGVRSASVSTTRAGWTVTVDYARVSRAGLDTPWTVTVHHPGGFPGPITLATSAAYFDMFESQGLAPEPSAETSTDRYIYQQFDPPPGDTLQVSFDAYIQPASQLGHSAETAVIVAGREVARVSYRTRLVP
jgi:hypothetical protein